ncbi:M23 family metallopeptidase [Candidatus Daviesbacteria bacterium]|nr:M23 family metallopeptidase [Candidatus Daviesbacteria bacterium]
MNQVNQFFVLWSFKRELFYVSLAFLIVLIMPVIAVILLTHAGIDIISDRLATVNEVTQAVEIHDPTTGEIVKEITKAVAWPALGFISLEFGEMSFVEPFHSGIDIANAQSKIGDPVNPFLPGKVIYAGEIWWGYGKHIIIDHGDNILSIYAHLDKIFVYKGQEITDTKQVIGNMGSTGWSTGPHLHFQINVYGIPVNPRTFLGSSN